MTRSLVLALLTGSLALCCLRNDSRAAPLPTVKSLQARLAEQIQLMVSAGHLRPVKCRFEQHCSGLSEVGWESDEYWHNPAELIYTLAIAIPHLPAADKPAAMSYLQQEFNAFPPHTYVHAGPSGASREHWQVPPAYQSNWAQYYEIRSQMTQADASWPGWTFDPFNVYACFKYAELFPAQAQTVLTAVSGKLKALPTDTAFLNAHPHVINQYIAGYFGYLKLQDLAGQTRSAQVESWLQSALATRVAALNVDPKNLQGSEAGGFLYLVPELGDHLAQNAKARVQQIVDYQNWAAPYWHISRAEETTRSVPHHTFQEGYQQHFYETVSQFQVRAQVLKWTQAQLLRYLDVPAVSRGDLYFIQNLVATMAAL